MSATDNRMPLIDALKAIASQLVLLHHFSAYGPLSAQMRESFPDVTGWLFEYARMAVQVFLVTAGFLAARALSNQGQGLTSSPFGLIWKRYCRLAPPYFLAIGLAVIGAVIASHWLSDEAIPARATIKQGFAHALLLQNLLGFDSLSAGVWYIAIDFQLFALMALLLWVGRVRFIAPGLVLCLAAISLFWFNRNPEFDSWGIYFFGSYGLGAAVWWASGRKQLVLWLGVITTVVIAALIFDFRTRILIALSVALLLGFSRRFGWLETWPTFRPLAFLGKISYSVFLVHFPIYLIANAIFAHFYLTSTPALIASLLFTWLITIALATGFYHWIENPVLIKYISSIMHKLKVRSLALTRWIAHQAKTSFLPSAP